MFHKKGRYVLPIFGTKGQVTIFIIIGILILAAFTVIYYFTSLTKTASLEVEQTRFVSNTPEAFEPIKLYTENCLSQVGERGVRLLGEQGGYIYPDLVGKFSLSNPTEFDGLYLDPIKVPYWYYNKQPNSGSTISIASLRPALYTSEDDVLSVEAQMRRYVSEKVGECLQGYKPFVDQGFEVVEQGSIEPVVLVRDHDVLVRMGMPLKLQKGESTAEFSQFVVSLPVELKRYYELASKITELERNETFLERGTMNMIDTHAGVDVNKLPPTAEMSFDAVTKAVWSPADIKIKIQELLAQQVPLLRFLGADNFYRYEYSSSEKSLLHQANYDGYILPIDGTQGLDLTFDYYNWPTYVDINNGADVIRPQTLSVHQWVLNFGFQQYYTTYDVSYPVLGTLQDPTAFGGRGYTFLFALESNIRNNQPVVTDQVLPAPIVSAQQSLLCEENQRDSPLVRSIVVDGSTGQPLDLVNIGFSLPEVENCVMGSTNKEGVFESSYPQVYGGMVSYVKEEYLTNFYPIDTYDLDERSQNIIGYASSFENYGSPVIELYPFKNINVSVSKKQVEKCVGSSCSAGNGLFSPTQNEVYSYKPQLLDERHHWYFYGTQAPLDPQDQAFLHLERIGDVDGRGIQDSFSATVSISGNQLQQISLVPGVYKVDGFLVRNQEVIIPEEECCSSGVFEAIGCQDLDGCCYTLDETRLETFMGGGIEWNDDSSYLTITSDQLYGAKEITFFVPNANILNVPARAHKRVLEDLQIMGEMANISRMPNVRSALEPVYR